jgi:hypothetical protein
VSNKRAINVHLTELDACMRALDSNNPLQNNSLGQRFSSTDLAQIKSHYNEICCCINKNAPRSKPFAALHIETGGVTPLRRREGLRLCGDGRGYAFAARGAVYALCNARTRNDLWTYLLVTKLQMRCHDV